MAMSIDDRAREAREQDETEDIAAWRAEQAWNELQAVPSHAERDRDAKREERAKVVARRREMLRTGICEHGSSLSLCPACSDLA